MVYITTGTNTIAGVINGLLIQANAPLTSGTLTLAAGGVTFAVITGPWLAGAQWRYNGLHNQGTITAVASTGVDMTASLLNRDV